MSKSPLLFSEHSRWVFRRRFPAVAPVAEALEVVWIEEQSQVALVIHDVVDVRGFPIAPCGLAPRPANELFIPEHLPLRELVKSAVSFGLVGSCVGFLRLVLGAVTIGHQLITARMAAWSHWFLHGLSPPEEQKRLRPNW